MMMPRYGLLPLAALAALPALAQSPGLRLLKQDAEGVTLDLATPPKTVRRLKGPKPVDQVRVPGWALTREVGRPELPVAGTLVRVPPEGELRVEILKETRERLRGLRLPTVARLVPPGEELPAAENALAPLPLYPEGLVEVSERFQVRGETLVRVILHPFRWNQRTQELECSGALTARLHFVPVPRPPAETGAAAPETRAPETAPVEAAPRAAEARTAEVRSGILLAPAQPQAQAQTQSGGSAPEATAPGPDRTPDPVDPLRTSVRIEVTQAGLYRLPYESLPLSDLDFPAILPGEIRLSSGGRDIPVRAVAANGHGMAPGDYFEFYAPGQDTMYSGTQVLRLSWNDRTTRRLETVDGDPGSASPTITSFQDHLHVEQNLRWWALTPGAPAQDFWFWERLTASPGSAAQGTYAFTLPAAANGAATLSVRLQGYTATAALPDHHTQLLLDGTPVGDPSETWDGQVEHVQTATLTSAQLAAGAHSLSVLLPGDTASSVDAVLVNGFDLDFARPLAAVAGKAAFTVQGSGEVVQAVGFPSSDIQLYDITDPRVPVRITGARVAAGGGGYQLTFTSSLPGTRSYVATTQPLTPSAVGAWAPSGLRRSQLNGADYILITPRSFLTAAAPLVRLRQDQGLRATAVAVEDIYGEFSDGVETPQAIQDFLTYAYAHWTAPAPAYVLLLGDATQDYRDYYGYHKYNKVPPHLSWTQDLGLTPDDNWYVTLGSSTEMPAMAVGRLPAVNAAAAATIVQKIIAYEQSATPAPAKALFVADDQSSEFPAASDTLAAMMTPGMQATKVYMGGSVDATSAKTAILGAINGGVHLVTYFGHGNTTYWTRDILDSTDVPQMTNSAALPFVMSFDCLNGYFAIPYSYCLGEELLAPADHGAIAVFAASGLGYTWEHELLGNQVYSLLFTSGKRVLGDICTQAKLAAYGQGATLEMIRMFTLLGDPAMKLKPHP